MFLTYDFVTLRFHFKQILDKHFGQSAERFPHLGETLSFTSNTVLFKNCKSVKKKRTKMLVNNKNDNND